MSDRIISGGAGEISFTPVPQPTATATSIPVPVNKQMFDIEPGLYEKAVLKELFKSKLPPENQSLGPEGNLFERVSRAYAKQAIDNDLLTPNELYSIDESGYSPIHSKETNLFESIRPKYNKYLGK